MIPAFFKKLLLYSVGHTYGNLSRLFLRLFTGVMFMQFGIRQWIYFDYIASDMIEVMGMPGDVSLGLMIAIEIVCSTLIILGLCSRLAVVPPLITMTVAENVILTSIVSVPPAMLFSTQPGYVPILFIGIFVYMLLAGPGKVSLDYLIAIRLLGADKQAEDELEKV